MDCRDVVKYAGGMKIAVIADVHGNSLALDAVLHDVAHENPDLIVNLGDMVSGPFDPARSADIQMSLSAVTVAGNHERQLLTGGTGASDAHARPRLSEDHWKWLGSLSGTASLLDGRVFACHGSPAGGDMDYLLENVSTGQARLDCPDAIRHRLIGAGNAQLVLCGHTHIPRVVMSDDVLIVNPGSVGMPAYDDDRPVAHVMEAGCPHARYALVTPSPSGWSVDLRAIPYDFEAAARQAEQAGRPEIAFGVRRGRMPR
ncbi:metallophosphoesterase family protein [Gluconacetobacter sacchari]|uniref:metallophosphoesterase family protein n=1 Tax=Gluconacetobacter sacchari TaxID=92759 RepID=UPI0039B53E45